MYVIAVYICNGLAAADKRFLNSSRNSFFPLILLLAIESIVYTECGLHMLVVLLLWSLDLNYVRGGHFSLIPGFSICRAGASFVGDCIRTC